MNYKQDLTEVSGKQHCAATHRAILMTQVSHRFVQSFGWRFFGQKNFVPINRIYSIALIAHNLSLCFETLQTLVAPSLQYFNISLKVEWAVRPPTNSVAALPDDATARVILPPYRTFARSIMIKKVLPEPPRASKINILPLLLLIDNITSSYVIFCSWFNWFLFWIVCNNWYWLWFVSLKSVKENHSVLWICSIKFLPIC